jgi:hypothetical protein
MDEHEWLAVQFESERPNPDEEHEKLQRRKAVTQKDAKDE